MNTTTNQASGVAEPDDGLRDAAEIALKALDEEAAAYYPDTIAHVDHARNRLRAALATKTAAPAEVVAAQIYDLATHHYDSTYGYSSVSEGGRKIAAGHHRAHGIAKVAAALRTPTQAPSTGAVVDPLQGAADWLKIGLVDATVGDIQSRLLIGYNRARRLFDAAPPVVQPASPAVEVASDLLSDLRELFVALRDAVGHPDNVATGDMGIARIDAALAAPTPAVAVPGSLLPKGWAIGQCQADEFTLANCDGDGALFSLNDPSVRVTVAAMFLRDLLATTSTAAQPSSPAPAAASTKESAS